MPETREITVYTVQELTGPARERALDTLREWAAQGDWWDYIESDARTIARLFGFTIDPGTGGFAFSGFWSQGDGASVTGTYAYKAQSRALVRQHAPQDGELHQIVADLARVQRAHGYKLTAGLTRDRGSHYCHEYTVTVTTYQGQVECDDATQKAVGDIFRRFMKWIYRQLEQEHEYLTSDAACLESADANDYRFTADGRIA